MNGSRSLENSARVVVDLPLVLHMRRPFVLIALCLESSQAGVLYLACHIVRVKFSSEAIADKLVDGDGSHTSVWFSVEDKSHVNVGYRVTSRKLEYVREAGRRPPVPLPSPRRHPKKEVCFTKANFFNF